MSESISVIPLRNYVFPPRPAQPRKCSDTGPTQSDRQSKRPGPRTHRKESVEGDAIDACLVVGSGLILRGVMDKRSV
jgi:hypothetical protein